MTLERLPYERWPELLDVFAEFGEGLPDETTQVYVLMDGERRVGCFLLEPVIHAGPFFVEPEYRGKGVGHLLAQHAIRLTAGQQAYVAALSPQTEYMCERLGLTRVQGSLWLKSK